MIEDSMYFADSGGSVVPKLPVDSHKRALVPDNKTIFNINQAAEHFKLDREKLRALWLDTFSQILELDDLDPASPEMTSAIPGKGQAAVIGNRVESAAGAAKRSLMSMFFPDLPEEFHEPFLVQCRLKGLNPFIGQCWPKVIFENEKQRVVLCATIDALRLQAMRTREYVGIEPPTFQMDGDLPASARCTVQRSINGTVRSFTAEVFRDELLPLAQEYAEDSKDAFCDRMPKTWLGKCAKAAALRDAFPQELGGVYVPEELEQLDRYNKSRTMRRLEDAQPAIDDDGAQIESPIKNPSATGIGPATWAEFVDRLAQLGIAESADRVAVMQHFNQKYPAYASNGRLLWKKILDEVAADPSRWASKVPA